MAENIALHTLAEDESLVRYQRKRLSQSFEKPSAQKKPKSHSLSSTNISVDKENVLQDLNEFPDDTKINWSKFARSHGVTNKNGGKIIKQIALDEGIDVLKLEHRSETPSSPLPLIDFHLSNLESKIGASSTAGLVFTMAWYTL